MSSESVKKLISLASKFESLISEAAKSEKKLDPKAKVRSRGKVIFPAESSKVTDNKDHYPINDAGQARNALARANQMSKAPEWYKGDLKSFLNTVVRAVHKHYPSIEISESAKRPGKG